MNISMNVREHIDSNLDIIESCKNDVVTRIVVNHFYKHHDKGRGETASSMLKLLYSKERKMAHEYFEIDIKKNTVKLRKGKTLP